MTPLETLLGRIGERKAVVGVVGLGYVGLPLALCFSEAGFRVLGFDIDPAKVASLNSGRSYLMRYPGALVQAARARGFDATADYSRAAGVDALILCVPTPLGAHREPDLSFVTGTMEALVPYLRRAQLVSLESTTYPGTTEEELKPRIEARGLRVGEDVFLCFSPEREDPGNPLSVMRSIPKILGGATPACLEAGRALYGAAIERVVPMSSTAAAEMTKLLENIHRAVNIGLVNEMKIIADRMGLDIHEIIRAAATKPFGFVPYYPGPGLGGHCIPVDPYYLSWKAREYDFATRFIELAGEVNTAMPYHVVDAIASALNDRQKSLKGSRVLLLGVAYKKDVDDLRESPSLKILELLTARGAKIDYNDPYFPEIQKLRHYNFEGMKSVQLDPKMLAGYDCALIATDHTSYDYPMIVESSQLVIDSRNATRRIARHRNKIILV